MGRRGQAFVLVLCDHLTNLLYCDVVRIALAQNLNCRAYTALCFGFGRCFYILFVLNRAIKLNRSPAPAHISLVSRYFSELYLRNDTVGNLGEFFALFRQRDWTRDKISAHSRGA